MMDPQNNQSGRSPAADRVLAIGLIFAGVALLLLAITLPRDWYDALPKNPQLPDPQVSGLMLLRWSIAIEGLVLIGVSSRIARWTRRASALFTAGPCVNADERVSHASALG